jgi:hypothetical protein
MAGLLVANYVYVHIVYIDRPRGAGPPADGGVVSHLSEFDTMLIM